MDDLFRCERDAIATLGLLARAYLLFDVPISTAGGRAPTHFRGLNVQCFIVDNADGELLAAESNQIHATENPLEHAEQRAMRVAIARVRQKRPRTPEMTVEEFYKEHLFMAPGREGGDFLRKGCTLYNTFDPCAMCAVTLLIASMKRIAYVFEDHVYEGFYLRVKEQYFSKRESLHGRVVLDCPASSIAAKGKQLLTTLDEKIKALLARQVALINVLDHLREDLAPALKLLQETSLRDLATTGADRGCNERTLIDVKRSCGLTI